MRKIVLLIGLCFVVMASFAQEAKLMLPIGHTNGVNTASFSPDGKEIVTSSMDNSAKIWDTQTGALLVEFNGHSNQVCSASFSHDGKKIVTASLDNTAKIWDAQTGSLLTVLKGHSGGVGSAYFSIDGKKVVTASEDSTAKIWDAQSGLLLANLNGHTAGVESASFSSDGQKVITASLDRTAKIWDAQTGSLLVVLKGHTGGVVSAYFSTDDKKVVTASEDSTAKIWDAQSGLLLANLTGHTNYVIGAYFSPDAKKVVTASLDSTAKIWDVQTGFLVTILKGHTGELNSASFSPNGKKIITSSWDMTAKIWDTETGAVLADLKGHTNHVISSSFSPDGRKVVTASGDRIAKIWDVKTGTLLADLNGHVDAVIGASFLPDGKKIVVYSSKCTAEIWDAKTGTLFSKIKMPTEVTSSFEISPDGTKILTSSWDKTAKIWDAKTGALLNTLSKHTNYVTSISFAPDSKKAVTASEDSTAKIWDVQTGSLLTSLIGHTGWVESASFSPDGKKIATTSGDSTTKIWDAETGAILADLKGHRGMVYDASFSHDSKKIVTNSSDGTVKIWDVQTGVLIVYLKGAVGEVSSASFSPDGTKVVTASDNGTAKLWDAGTGTYLFEFKGHTGTVRSAQFSPDNKEIVTTADDGTAKLWDAETRRLLCTFLAVDSTDYLVTDPYGRYDGTEGARKLLYFTCGTEVIGLDQVKDQLWVPNLAERIMRGDSINAKKLSDLDICGLIPQVEKEDKNGYHFIITPQRGGLGETVVYVNGIEEKRYKPSQLTKTTTGYELNLDEKELAPYFISGQENPVTVKAYTANNDISSRGAEIIQDETKKKSIAPNLYAVMIGVSDYKGPELQLKYAAKDAEDISAAISASAKKLLDTAGGKEHVFMYNLTTGKNHYELPEKIAIKNLFAEIGKKATANDILLIFFAGHGVTSGEKKQFYFLTADASQASATDAPDQVGISTKELSEWMQPSNIKAQKRILILDACNSGQAIKELVKVGADGQNYLAARNDDKAEQIKAIDKLNEKSGLFILAASASNQSAYEMGRYSQGLLTYSLLKAIKQEPDILEDNKYLNVSRWFTAAEKTVSDMVRETGNRQEPQIVSAGNFNIGVVDQDVMAGIKLADEKPLFTASNFQNSDETIADDDLGLNNLLDNKLNEISSRGENNDISYIARTASPDAYLLSGRYEVKGEAVTIRVNIKQNKAVKYKFELSGKKSDLALLAEQVVDKATDWILKNK